MAMPCDSKILFLLPQKFISEKTIFFCDDSFTAAYTLFPLTKTRYMEFHALVLKM